MILSHEHKFIFLRTIKTAGTSVEIALSKFCGPRDVLTPMSPVDSETRRALGYRGAQNYWLPLHEHGLRDLARLVVRRKRTRKFYHHMTATEVRALVGDDIWNSYYKLAIDRNPWDRFLSFYHWRVRHRSPQPTFRELVDEPEVMRLRQRGLDLYSIDGKVAVDKVCRFEHLAEDLEEVRLKLGLPEPLTLPHAKGNIRTDKRHYREVLDDHTRDRIATLFREEIRLHGYEF